MRILAYSTEWQFHRALDFQIETLIYAQVTPTHSTGCKRPSVFRLDLLTIDMILSKKYYQTLLLNGCVLQQGAIPAFEYDSLF